MRQPFDQRVVNPLERPVTIDPNLGFSQDSGTLRTALSYLYQNSFETSGFIADGFKPYAPLSGRNVLLRAGLGFKYSTANNLTIGGVQGVDDASPFKPLLLKEDKLVTIAAAPATGLARRDVIAVQPYPHLADPSSSRVFSVATGAFTLQNQLKTLSWDLSGTVVNAPIEGGAARIIYLQGVTTAYDSGNPDSILNAPLPNVPDAYEIVAVVNVIGGASNITAADVVDYRARLFPGGSTYLRSQPVVGAGERPGGPPGTEFPGQVLENPVVSTVPWLQAFLSRTAENSIENEYQLTVIGNFQGRGISIGITPNVVTNSGGLEPQYTKPIGSNIVASTASAIASAADVAMWANTAQTPLGGTFAIGQPYAKAIFRIGTSEAISFGPTPAVIFDTRTISFNPEGTAIHTVRLMLQAML